MSRQVVTFKRHAHLFTLIAVVWMPISALTIGALCDTRDRGYRIYLIETGLLLVHAVCKWWPGWCLAYDVVAAAYLATLVLIRKAAHSA